MIGTGKCLCGGITFKFDTAPTVCVSCHCRDCQYAAGGHPSVAVVVPIDSLTIQGEIKEYCSKADSGVEVYRSFCPTCGTPLFARNERWPETVAIKLGALDEPNVFSPNLHIWTDSAQPWHYVNPNVKQIPKP